MSRQKIPFDASVPYSRLSFLPLIRSLKKTITERRPGAQKLYRKIITSVESIPELVKPIEDLSLLEKHTEIVETLLSTIFPPATSQTESIYAVAIPFTFNTIYASPVFESSFLKPGTKEINIPDAVIADKLYSERIFRAYYVILNKYNGYNTPPSIATH